MSDKLTNIDEKIQRLKKRREKLQTQQAIHFMREAQRIFQDGFTPDIALNILSKTWSTASESQKKDWRKLVSSDRGGRADSFRPTSNQETPKKPPSAEHTNQQS